MGTQLALAGRTILKYITAIPGLLSHCVAIILIWRHPLIAMGGPYSMSASPVASIAMLARSFRRDNACISCLSRVSSTVSFPVPIPA